MNGGAGNGGAGLPALALGWAMLASPTPAAAQADGAARQPGCAVLVTAAWMPPGGKSYRVGAIASGRTCGGANVTLTISDPAGATLLTFASAVADLPLLFAGAATPAAMTMALRRWIEQRVPPRTTRALPGWEAGAAEPGEGATTFRPEPAITRGHYAELRKWGQPVFAFVQGSESEAWYALDAKADTLTLVGTQGLAG